MHGKCIIGEKKASSSILPDYNDASSLAQDFMLFFNNKVEKFRNQLDSSASLPCRFTQFQLGHAFNGFSPITESSTLRVVNSIKSKSCILDPIPTVLLKSTMPQSVLTQITRIVNDSLLSGTFPSSLKTAVVRPLLKKSGCFCNYVPLFLLPHSSTTSICGMFSNFLLCII